MKCLCFLGCFVFFAAIAKAADDEIDYSAPYVTLEDGVLVTRYPDKPHNPQNTRPSDDHTTTDSSQSIQWPSHVFLLLLALTVIAAWGWRRHRTR